MEEFNTDLSHSVSQLTMRIDDEMFIKTIAVLAKRNMVLKIDINDQGLAIIQFRLKTNQYDDTALAWIEIDEQEILKEYRDNLEQVYNQMIDNLNDVDKKEWES